MILRRLAFLSMTACATAGGQLSVPAATAREVVVGALVQRIAVTGERNVVLCGVESLVGADWRAGAGDRIEEYAPTAEGTWCVTGKPDSTPRVYLVLDHVVRNDETTISLEFRRIGPSSKREEKYVFRRSGLGGWYLLSITLSGFVDS